MKALLFSLLACQLYSIQSKLLRIPLTRTQLGNQPSADEKIKISLLAELGNEASLADLGNETSLVELDDETSLVEQTGLRHPPFQSLNNYLAITYTVNISVGTPPTQNFRLVVDTGSIITWIQDVTCVMCYGNNFFDGNVSSTFVPTNESWNIKYADNSIVSGLYGIDTIRLTGNTNEALVIKNQYFGRADTWSQPSTLDHGTLALPSPYTANESSSRIIFANAVEQNLVEKPIFTIWFGMKHGNEGGEISYGGLDSDHCMDVDAFHDILPQSLWAVDVDSISFGDALDDAISVIISDSGSSLINGPPILVSAIAANLGAVFSRRGDIYLVDCEGRDVPIIITIGKFKYYIHRKSYVFPLNEIGITEYCGLAVIPSLTASFGGVWAMGSPFFREYCQVYDYGAKKIGFAKVKHRNNPVDVDVPNVVNTETTENSTVSTRNDSIESEVSLNLSAQMASYSANSTADNSGYIEALEMVSAQTTEYQAASMRNDSVENEVPLTIGAHTAFHPTKSASISPQFRLMHVLPTIEESSTTEPVNSQTAYFLKPQMHLIFSICIFALQFI